MRDIIVALFAFGALPYILKKPHIGLYFWALFGYLSPHRLTFGFAYGFPFVLMFAAATLFSLAISKEKKTFPWNAVTITWVLFILWMMFTTIFALFPDIAVPQLIKIIKIQTMIFVTFLVINSKDRLTGLVWVIVISFGFYGIKGGIFAVLTGGQSMIFGPPGSFIEGNNELAFALVMTLPLLRYLQFTSENKWVKRGLLLGMALLSFSILASYSRGAALALVLISVFLILKSNRKFLFGVLVLVSLPIGYTVMPDKWKGRMDTVQDPEKDSSAMGRIYVWKMAYLVARDNPITGGGFGTFDTRTLHEQYAFEISDKDNIYIATDAHSVYFLILGEHGFIGLGIFLALLFVAFRSGTWTIKHCKKREDLQWASQLAAMSQVSLIGFASAGAFVGQSYFDLLYHIIALLALTQFHVKKTLEQEKNGEPAEAPADEEPSRLKSSRRYRQH